MELSDHIPDINLITLYAERQTSLFSRVSPWTKLIALILVVLMITITTNPVILTVIYVGIMIMFWSAGLPVRRLVAWYALPVVFVLSLVGIIAWNEPGNVIFSLPIGYATLQLTDAGFILVILLLVKALISFTCTIFFLMTTRYEYLSGLIYRLFPSPLDEILLLSYRFLFLTITMIGSLLKSINSRGGGLMHSFRMQGRIFAEVAGLVIIRSFDQAEHVSKAMIARGYTSQSYGARTPVPSPTTLEYLVLVFWLVLIIVTGYFHSYSGVFA